MADHVVLSDRRSRILQAVVEEYIATGQPVGSGRIADRAGVSVSSATIRNEMVQLENEGYLLQPHTSAGRIPTDSGYRFYVDHLSGTPRLGRGQNQRVAEFFDQTHGALEVLLRDTTRLLASLTDCAAVVTGPGRNVATIRSVQLVDLTGYTALVVVVLSSGAIEKRTLELGAEVGADAIARASAELDGALRGTTLGTLHVPETTGNPEVDALVVAVIEALVVTSSLDPIYVGGRSRVAASFDTVESVREVLGLLERQIIVVSLLRDVLGRGQSVAIGNETGVENLAECSLVVAPYRVEGESVGTIGLLGPTRMDYAQALAAVAVVGNSLGERLGTG